MRGYEEERRERERHWRRTGRRGKTNCRKRRDEGKREGRGDLTRKEGKWKKKKKRKKKGI